MPPSIPPTDPSAPMSETLWLHWEARGWNGPRDKDGCNAVGQTLATWALKHLGCFPDSRVFDEVLSVGVNLHAPNRFEHTPLMTAAAHAPQCIPPLLDAGVDVNAVNAHGWTALMMAVSHHPETVRMLLEAGADTSVRDRSDAVARDWATLAGRDDCVRVLDDWALKGRLDEGLPSSGTGGRSRL